MKELKLNQPKKDFTVKKDSWLMKFFMFVRTEGKSNLPTDSCDLRNEMIMSFFLFSLTAPMFFIIKPIVKRIDEDMSPWIPMIVTLLGFMITALIHIDNGTPWIDSLPLAILNGMGIHGLGALAIGWYLISIIMIVLTTLIFATVFGVGYLFYKLYSLRKNTGSVVGKLYSDMRKKVCSPVKYIYMKFIYFLGILNLVALSIRLFVGQIQLTKSDIPVIWKIANLFEVIGVIWITFIIITNFNLFYTLL